jgi:hypothetical protein
MSEHKRKLHRLRNFLDRSAGDPTTSLSADFARKLRHKHKHKHKHHHDAAPASPAASATKPSTKPLPPTTSPLKVGKHVIKVETVTPPAKPRTSDEKFEPRQAILAEVRDLIELVDTAKTQYQDLPDGENAMALTALLRELRGLTSDFVSLGDDDLRDLLTKLHQTVLAPVFRRVVGTVIKEHRSLRRQLGLALGEQYTPVIDREIKNSLKNYGPRLQAEYELVVQRAAEQLGVTDKVQPLLDRIDSAIRHSKKS